MADSEPVQGQRKSISNLIRVERGSKAQNSVQSPIENHSDEVNGESTPDSVIQPKQTVGEYVEQNKKSLLS